MRFTNNVPRCLLLVAILFFALQDASAQVGIGTTTPEASAQLDVSSTSKGFLPPRLTGSQRNSIVSPVAGLMIYCTDCGPGGQIQFFNGTSWVNMINGTSVLPPAQNLGADIDGEAANDQSGISVSLSADGARVVIGAPFNDGSGSDAGHVRIYEWNGTNWNQIGADINGELGNDFSGAAVSISADGNLIAIGGYGNDGGGAAAGHVRIYQLYGGTWSQVWSDIDGEAANDQSGTSVSISSDGSRIAVGATGNDGIGSNAGHVRVFY